MAERDNQNQSAEAQTEPVVPAATQAEKNTVEIDADVLQKLLNDVSELKQKTGEYEQTASQDQIRKIEALRQQGKLVKSVKLRRFEGGLVLGWKIVKDNVWFADGKLYEEQIMKVLFDNGSSKEVSLVQFTRGTTYESYEVVKEAKTQTGDMEFTVLGEGGKEIVINSKYVN